MMSEFREKTLFKRGKTQKSLSKYDRHIGGIHLEQGVAPRLCCLPGPFLFQSQTEDTQLHKLYRQRQNGDQVVLVLYSQPLLSVFRPGRVNDVILTPLTFQIVDGTHFT